jgi:hypothetical protein
MSEGRTPVSEARAGFGRAENTVVVLTASAMDKGAGTLPPLRGSAEVVVRSRRQRAAFFDHGEEAAAQDNLDQGGLVARIQPGGWIGFDRIRLQDVGHIKLSAWPQGNEPMAVSILAGDREISRTELRPGPATARPAPEFLLPLPAVGADARPQEVRLKLEGGEGSVLDVMWVDFVGR